MLNKILPQLAVNFFVIVGVYSSASAATVLYQAGNNTFPSDQDWFYLQSGGIAQQSINSGLYTLSTQSNSDIRAGNFRFDQVFDTNVGFRLNLMDLQIIEENHSNNDRAGFSLLFIGDNPTQSLELAFWEDRIWIYDYDNDFTQGIGVDLATTESRDYTLDVEGGNFKLLVDGVEQLSSSLVNYSEASPTFPNPPSPFDLIFAPRSIYNFSNTLFFGDDTTQANSQISLSKITFEAKSKSIPEPLTIIGTVTALGFGTLFKRKNAFKKEGE